MPDDPVAAHYTSSDLGKTIVAALRAAGKDLDRLTPDDLAPVDEFHGGQRPATVRLAELVGLAGTERVLDVGSGLGGPSRYLAWRYGCRVSGIDLTPAFVRVAEMLTRRTGLVGKVDYRQGDALALPFEDRSFDVVWSQNAAMNIADRDRLYCEMRRVLKPGGKLALQEVATGPGGPPHYPVQWAHRRNQLSLLAGGDPRQARSCRLPRSPLAGHNRGRTSVSRGTGARRRRPAATIGHALDPARRLAGDVPKLRAQTSRSAAPNCSTRSSSGSAEGDPAARIALLTISLG